jgi:2-hydroxycyclohexanecarboxyl-CoA dehydrogenase
MKLEGKAALVTGAARGIGRAVALGLAREGARLALVDVLRDQVAGVTAEIQALRREAYAIGADLTVKEDVDYAVNEALERLGTIDIVVNNVGWDRFEFFLDSAEETWDRLIALNFKTVLRVCRAALPHMVQHGGAVINVASDAGRTGSLGEAVYSATKGAVIAFTKALAREMVRYRITVNVVCPGLIETALLQSIRDQSERAHKVMDAVARAIPMGRTGTAEEVAAAVVFLASDEAGYITGQTLSVDGGLTMQ